ncbi:5695_t:CDS:2, partial [Racocetra persica]
VPADWPPIHQEIGPILPDTFPNLSSDLDQFLSTHSRTMYIALGTIVYTTPKNYAIMLQSALELINQNILDGVIWTTVQFNESELPSSFTLSTGSSHESMYTATPMLVLPIAFDQAGNAEKLELTGMALKLSKLDLKVDDIVSKVIRLMNESSFKMNAERMQVLAKFNSKRKYRAADLIDIVMNLAKREGVRNEYGELEVDNEALLRHWITPYSRMGTIRGKYLDVFGAAVIISIALISSLVYGVYKTIRFIFKKWYLRGGSPRKSSLKEKNK